MARPKMSDEQAAARKGFVKANAKATYAAVQTLKANHADEFTKLYDGEMKTLGFEKKAVRVTDWVSTPAE